MKSKLAPLFGAIKTAFLFLWSAFAVNHSFGVLTGSVAAELAGGSDDDLANDVVASPKLTLADLVRTILVSPKATAAKKVVVEIASDQLGVGASGMVSVYPSGTAVAADGTSIATLTKDDATKKGSSPMSNGTADIDNEAQPERGGLQDVLTELIATRKPSVALSTVLNAVENYILTLDAAGRAALGVVDVIVDQATGAITVKVGATVDGAKEAEFLHDTTPAAEETVYHFDN